MMIMVSIILGCKTFNEPVNSGEPFEYRFKKTQEKDMFQRQKKNTVTVRFDGVPFSQAMSILTQETNIPIVWSRALDETTASGTFNGVPLSSVLDVLARRSGANVAEVGGVFYLGEIRREDRAFTVLRIPPVKKEDFLFAVKQSCSIEGVVSVVGSCVWICDNLESLRKLVSAVETIRDRSERSYVAELYFIRVNEEHFVRLSAELQFNSIDVFSSSFNVEQLFSMFVEGEGTTGWSELSQRPVLYLSEGRRVTFSDGKEITRERKTLTENGAVETTGYSKFTDGLQLTMLLNRVSDKSYAVDIDLSVSIFDRNDKSSIPATDKSELKSEGLLVQDSQVYYIGSLRRDNRSNKSGIFSFDANKSYDMITIWLRVRELHSSL
ncbi:MAG: hypothetical protein LBI18_09945 [Planctomycetaceae bacterium]|nr:hypothetical protein [Planctomycetaceae bacterium]